MYLEPVLDAKHPTLWVDGKRLGFNPTFLAQLPLREAAGALAHETLHCAFEHPLRRGARDKKLWNIAADHAVNAIVRASGLPLPAGSVETETRFLNKGAEEIYAILEGEQQPQSQGAGSGQSQQQGQQGSDGGGQPQSQPQAGKPASGPVQGRTGGGSPPTQGKGQGGAGTPVTGPAGAPSGPETNPGDCPTGEVRDLPGGEGGGAGPAEQTANADEWKIRVQQAVNNARGQGFFPAELERVVEKILTPKVDWREELRRFFHSISRSEASWRSPNRRFIASGLYLPGMRSEASGPLVVGIDTSGSIGQRLLAQFAAELSTIIEDTKPEVVYVVYCDAAVQGVAEFTADDLPLEFHPRGGGGTDFRPVFDWVEQNGIRPDCLVYMTDTEGSFPVSGPDYPVLWASTHGTQVPFGEIIKISPIY